jgi:hypothetical protein
MVGFKDNQFGHRAIVNVDHLPGGARSIGRCGAIRAAAAARVLLDRGSRH